MSGAPPPSAELLARALAGDAPSLRELVHSLSTIVQARVARVLLRREALGRGRDVRQELEDLVQEVFAALFAENGRALRQWAPERGLSLANFVGLLAEREAISILRSGRRSPWTEDPTLDNELAAHADAGDATDEAGDAHGRLASREALQYVLDRLQASLSPKGLQLFHWLLVEQREVAEVCAAAELTPDAVYAWRSRLGKLLRSLAAELASDSVPSSSDLPSSARSPQQRGAP